MIQLHTEQNILTYIYKWNNYKIIYDDDGENELRLKRTFLESQRH